MKENEIAKTHRHIEADGKNVRYLLYRIHTHTDTHTHTLAQKHRNTERHRNAQSPDIQGVVVHSHPLGRIRTPHTHTQTHTPHTCPPAQAHTPAI